MQMYKLYLRLERLFNKIVYNKIPDVIFQVPTLHIYRVYALKRAMAIHLRKNYSLVTKCANSCQSYVSESQKYRNCKNDRKSPLQALK